LFKQGDVSIADSKLFFRSKGMMFGSILIQINEKAEEHLGDLLLEEEDEQIEVTEEFKDLFLHL
jgi:hypothetical protein